MAFVGGKPRAYTPANVQSYKEKLALHFRRGYRGRPLNQPVRLDVTVYMPRPIEHKRGKPTGRLTAVGQRELPTCKPDSDNYAKVAMDALTLAGVLKDDAVVTDMRCRKRWAPNVGALVVRLTDDDGGEA